MSPMICPAGTAGCAAKYRDPSSPCSSAVTARKIIDRFGLAPDAFKIRATSKMGAIPDASAIAPL